MKKIALAIHGGAGTILKSKMTPDKEVAYTNALQTALNKGYEILEKGGTALEAVEVAVSSLEDSPLFNAGRGSVFTAKGEQEMDASIMEGKDLQAGAIAGVKGIKNPIQLARLVMEKSGHVMLAAEGAVEFAKEQNIEFAEADYFYDQYRYEQWQALRGSDSFQLDHSTKKDEKFGTVGAVALDLHGDLAAATSTGGMTNKKYGRIGDSPIIGAGTYANNNTCAVSCTGSGEFFIRSVVAYDVSCIMEYKGSPLTEACQEVVHKRLMKINGDGGLIAIDKNGNVCLEFNTEGMYRAFKTPLEEQVKIYKN
ncbi:MAG: isoaspartyl peptidase/L-asparaginase [Saprospiraceae bacterium]|nr:isoaspartyl peptidase/L-asparaginase [Saprospiraceae bacterium]